MKYFLVFDFTSKKIEGAEQAIKFAIEKLKKIASKNKKASSVKWMKFDNEQTEIEDYTEQMLVDDLKKNHEVTLQLFYKPDNAVGQVCNIQPLETVLKNVDKIVKDPRYSNCCLTRIKELKMT